ncbi:MAG: enoyl-CoA hydratase/isomerase family protein [Actinomycetota bacterium]
MTIEVVKDDGITTITINRPERRNALDLPHFADLAAAWEDFRDDDKASVAIITGTGKDFTVGADLKSFVPAISGNTEQMHKDMLEGKKVGAEVGLTAVLRNFELWKPVIAAVNGTCVAGGMEMLMGTDIRIASTNASFGIFEPKRGLFPGGGTTVRLPRQIPFPWAMEVLLVCDAIDAEKAFRMGIVNAVVPPEQLLDEAKSWARRIMANAPLAVEATKRSVLKGLSLDLQSAYDYELQCAAEVFMTEDAKEGPRAFAEKRQPVWQRR